MQMNNRAFRVTVYVALLCIAMLIARTVVLGNARVVHLATADAFTGLTAQYLAPDKGKLQQPGKNFNIKGVQYFDNRQWAVLSVEILSEQNNTETMVVHKVNSSYDVVLGPGTSFPGALLKGLPADVAAYLNTKGAIYGTPE